MRILISGGGIGGMTAAKLLHDNGHAVTVIEKARVFTNAGFAISLKSFGVEILQQLGLEEKLRAMATPSEFVNFHKPDGTLIRSLSYQVLNKNLSDSVFATRAGIHQVIYESVRNDVDILMNTTIEIIRQDPNKVTVFLSNKKILHADLLVIAEGLRSTTRSKIMNDVEVEDFNIFYLSGRLKGTHNYKLGQFKSFMGLKKMIAILPLSEDELAVQSYIHHTDDVAKLKANAKVLLREAYKDFNDEVRSLIKEVIEKGILFSDKMGIVHAQNLVGGRIVLLGDAGYCPTALSGMGASLAIYGAKALAHFISQSSSDLTQALKSYNLAVKPIADKFQKNARKNANTFLPLNRLKLFISNATLKIAPESLISLKMRKELGLKEKQKQFVNVKSE